MIETSEEVLRSASRTHPILPPGDDLIEGRQGMMSAEPPAGYRMNPAHRWQTSPRPCCAGAPGRRQLVHQVGAFPSCRALGYRPAEYPALYILGGEWTGASAPIHPSKLFFASSTVCPSTPAADRFGICATDSSAPDVMSQRREAEFRFASSFRCYLFKLRFHGQLIFSLNRRPCFPLNGAHVAQEQFTCASPCGRLLRPPSTISQYDFHSIVRPSSPWRLVGPYKLSFEPDGSPLFTSKPLVACWRYEPREHLRPLAKTRPLIPPSP